MHSHIDANHHSNFPITTTYTTIMFYSLLFIFSHTKQALCSQHAARIFTPQTLSHFHFAMRST